jgi:thioredoxin reductase
MWDVIIVGGGTAGKSAALILGRCRRRALIFDSGAPRNAKSRSLNGFLSRDGIVPQELQQISTQQLSKYPTVESKCQRVDSVKLANGGFAVSCSGHNEEYCRSLLLATGITDDLPGISGLNECYGISAFHCPYCDGWEVRDQPLVVLGSNPAAGELARKLLGWSNDVVLCCNGRCESSVDEQSTLALLGIQVIEREIARLNHSNGELEAIEFKDGTLIERAALFFAAKKFQRSPLAESLGCRFDDKGYILTSDRNRTSVPGLYVAGDASGEMQLSITAAADGAAAAVIINTDLAEQDQIDCITSGASANLATAHH